jgi:type IV secretion system protein VirD4
MSQKDSIFKGFLRGNPRNPQAIAPAEQFQDEQNVLDSAALEFSLDNKEGKLFLGVVGATIEVDPKQPRLPDGRTSRYAVGGKAIGCGDDRHFFLLSSSRGGKGRTSIIPNLFLYPGSVLAIDPKAELCRITAAHRSKRQKVYALDPFGEAGEMGRRFAASFNAMDILVDSPDPLADAGLIGEALFVASDKADDHWNDSAKQLVEGLILHAATHKKYENRRNLVTVYELLWRVLKKDPSNSNEERYALQVEMEENTAANGAVMHAAADLYDRPERERDSVLSTARRHLHFLGYAKIQNILKRSSFDIRDLKREQITVYLCLPAMRMSTCSRFFRLFVNLSLASMEMEKTIPSYQVLFMLDEYAVMGRLASMEAAVGQLAGLGCKLFIVLQDLNQLRAIHGDKWESFLANAGIIQAFSNSDLTSLEWLSRRLGTTTITNQSQSGVAYETAASTGVTGKSSSTSTCELMSAGEIARFFGRDDYLLRSLVIRPSVPPIVLQRAFYDKHEFFQKFKAESGR